MAPTDFTTDWDLMARLAAGEERALDDLLARWEEPVLNFLYRQLGNAADAEDVASQTFWRVYESCSTVRPGGSFSAWLFRIAYNLAMDHHRHAKRRPRMVPLGESSDEIGEPAASAHHRPDRALLGRELGERIESALNQLPENQRAALTLCKLEGLSYQEIAAVLECSVSAVESLIFRARQNLQKLLADYLQK